MPTKKVIQRKRRHNKIRTKILKLKISKPRLMVSRSLLHTYVQLIDDSKGLTIVAHSDAKEKKGTKTEKAFAVGKEIAKLAQEKGVNEVAFDRNGYKYHGRVKALAEGAREGGLKF